MSVDAHRVMTETTKTLREFLATVNYVQPTVPKTETSKHTSTRAPDGRSRFRSDTASPRRKVVDALAVPLLCLHHRHLLIAAAFIVPAAIATSSSSDPLVVAHAAGAAAATAPCCCSWFGDTIREGGRERGRG